MPEPSDLRQRLDSVLLELRQEAPGASQRTRTYVAGLRLAVQIQSESSAKDAKIAELERHILALREVVLESPTSIAEQVLDDTASIAQAAEQRIREDAMKNPEGPLGRLFNSIKPSWQKHYQMHDGACRFCSPGNTFPGDFICAYHTAEAILSDRAETPKERHALDADPRATQ